MPQYRASLEHLIETEGIGIETLHPGGLDMTRRLAELRHVPEGVLSCLPERSHCAVDGIDRSLLMLEKANRKAVGLNGKVTFQRADAHHLPLHCDIFETSISECTIRALDNQAALKEVARQRIKDKLAEIEDERSETFEGLADPFLGVGLSDVRVADKPYLLKR